MPEQAGFIEPWKSGRKILISFRAERLRHPSAVSHMKDRPPLGSGRLHPANGSSLVTPLGKACTADTKFCHAFDAESEVRFP